MILKLCIFKLQLRPSTLCGLTVEEALWAITRGGAKALGLEDRGRLAPGELADFVVVDHHDWRALLYQPGSPPIAAVQIAGEREPDAWLRDR